MSELPATADVVDDRAPRVTRRHVTGSESARGLLFTIMGEFVLPEGAPVWTSTFIDVLGRLGVEPKTTRQALMRTGGDGWLVSERVGRRTRWSLTQAAERLLDDGTRRIYGFRAVQREWDRRWLVVLVRAPETDRSARHHLRTRLQWAGCGDPVPGVWISTHVSRRGEVEAVIDEAGLARDAQIFVAAHETGSLPTMVDQAWDLPTLETSYEQFAEDYSTDEADDAMTAVTELVHAWRRFPWLDPTLPDELLPANWMGTRAAELFTARHGTWTTAARAQWNALNARD